ncbi:MAG: fimbrillin family protein [Bacteroidales bacterium]|nr:fimbrillin family protein [Bacteroidales bacterium]
MKKTLLIAALAFAALVSCSKDQVVQLNQDEIKYSVVAENATKAAEIFCAYNYMDGFTVYADYKVSGGGPILYINGDEMNVSDAGVVSYKNGTPTRYWPTVDANNTMDFYAIANGPDGSNGTFNKTTSGAPTITGYIVNGTVGEQVDMLYAVNAGVNNNGSVALNFRHALSLIEFRAKNENENIKVTVTGVKVGGVKSVGTFTYPLASTSSQNTEHTDNTADAELNAGTWSGQATVAEYEVAFTDVELTLNDVKPLTYKESHNQKPSTNYTSYFANSMILLPQELDSPWDKNNANLGTASNGAYLAVECTICNNDASSTQLHTGYAYMPLGDALNPPTWKPGKKYVYTFVFGDGNGGYTDQGQPVLSDISYTVTVDDFDAFAGGNSDVEME